MAETPITAIMGERQEERLVRDCANPLAAPMVRKGKVLRVLSVSTGLDMPTPDEVSVNGVRFARERVVRRVAA